MSKEVVEDFENGIEYVDALEILDMRQKGDARRFLIRYAKNGIFVVNWMEAGVV